MMDIDVIKVNQSKHNIDYSLRVLRMNHKKSLFERTCANRIVQMCGPDGRNQELALSRR